MKAVAFPSVSTQERRQYGNRREARWLRVQSLNTKKCHSGNCFAVSPLDLFARAGGIRLGIEPIIARRSEINPADFSTEFKPHAKSALLDFGPPLSFQQRHDLVPDLHTTPRAVNKLTGTSNVKRLSGSGAPPSVRFATQPSQPGGVVLSSYLREWPAAEGHFIVAMHCEWRNVARAVLNPIPERWRANCPVLDALDGVWLSH